MRRDIETLRFDLTRKVADDEVCIVAQGVQFHDGTVVLRWLGETPSTAIYASWTEAMRVHHVGDPGHKPWTTAQWHDGVCFACGSRANWIGGGNGAQCTRCSATWDGPPNRVVDPQAGTWRGPFVLPARKEADRG